MAVPRKTKAKTKSKPSPTRRNVATRRPVKSTRKNPAAKTATLIRSRSVSKDEATFQEVVRLIETAREAAFQVVNTTLIELYWQVGEYISRKLEAADWGEKVVEQLARFISQRHPDIKGFTRANLFRMRQFFETYNQNEIVAPLVRQLSWSHNLIIIGRCKSPEEREFYLRTAIRERWGKRDLERQLRSALFERTILTPPIVAPLVRQLAPAVENIFKDAYMLEFLDLPEVHSEADLQSQLVAKLKQFILELGRDFCFVGEQYQIQVGNRDFRIDLVFYHRELQCLIAIELKIDEFQPEYLGKLEFELEALDRDVRKGHERPSIGLLLCASKDKEVVEYALSRSLSPAMISEYKTKLPHRQLLQRKLHEFYRLAAPELPPERPASRGSVKTNKAKKKR